MGKTAGVFGSWVFVSAFATNGNKAGAKSGQTRHVLITNALVYLTFFTIRPHDRFYCDTIRLDRTITAALANFFVNNDGFRLVGDDAAFTFAPQFGCTTLYVDYRSDTGN